MPTTKRRRLPVITEAEVRDLRRAAGQAGDLAQVAICDAALDRGPRSRAWAICREVVWDAAGRANRDRGRDLSPRRAAPSRDRRSQTQAERLASLNYNIRDAREALQNAAAMGRWADVVKYANQLLKLERDRFTSSTRSRRRSEREERNLTGAEWDALNQQRRRGRTGVP